mmetsp:Transcript_12246/g.20086  ORF Transcript_12246/g.20086 Transcript_12246/m.20086 type:complete len:265 (+) Transcript_12246:1069-1863(+)
MHECPHGKSERTSKDNAHQGKPNWDDIVDLVFQFIWDVDPTLHLICLEDWLDGVTKLVIRADSFGPLFCNNIADTNPLGSKLLFRLARIRIKMIQNLLRKDSINIRAFCKSNIDDKIFTKSSLHQRLRVLFRKFFIISLCNPLVRNEVALPSWILSRVDAWVSCSILNSVLIRLRLTPCKHQEVSHCILLLRRSISRNGESMPTISNVRRVVHPSNILIIFTILTQFRSTIHKPPSLTIQYFCRPRRSSHPKLTILFQITVLPR